MTVVRGLLPALCIIAVFISLPGCSPKASDIMVLTVGTQKINLAEYENFYLRNSANHDAAEQSTQEDRERFLDLLTNYKLKLADAYDDNLLSDPEIQKELAEYRTSLASTFMLDRELTEPGVKALYERRKINLHAAHILLSVKPDAEPADTLKAYMKAVELIERAKKGEPIETLATQYSEDPSVKTNHGDLYYFTAGVWVKPVEDAVYTLKKGEVYPFPVRSVFGYHVIKLYDIEPARTLRVRHLMTRFQSTAPDSAETANALARIRGIQDSLKKGARFEQLALKLSEDAGSAADGGLLPAFERRRFIEPFEQAAFQLKLGQTSDVVRTPFGFHIIRLDSVNFPGSYEETREQLKGVYQKVRYNDDYASYVSRLKKEFNYSFNEQSFSALLAQLDSTKSSDDSAWDAGVSEDVRKMPLFVVGTKTSSVGTIISAFSIRPEYRTTTLRRSELVPKIERLAQVQLLDAKSTGLETRYPEFAALMKEYTDGVILYKAEQLAVWGKSSVSDSSLKAFYEENKSQFMFPERVNINEILLESDTLLLTVYDSLAHGVNFNELASRWNDDAELKSKKGARGFVAIDADKAAQHAAKLQVGTFSEPIDLEQDGFAIVQLLEKDPAHQKTYEEAGAEVSNMYQEHSSRQLEQTWLDRIKLRHPVLQYKENLKKAFTSQHSSH